MKDLRPLLIDCRIELRKHQRDFQKSQLCERLDLMLQSVSADADAASPPVLSAATNTAPPERTQTANQVALAWQAAARDLKFTQPALYQQLSDKVMRLLGSRSLVDSATEILQLQAEVERLQRRMDEVDSARQRIEVEQNTLLSTLTDAVPDIGNHHTSALAAALARVNHLISQGPATTAAPSGSGSTERSLPQEPHIPTQAILQAVAEGARLFSDDQRNWAVGEGMVLSGFQFTPVELIEHGDQNLAQLILDKQKP